MSTTTNRSRVVRESRTSQGSRKKRNKSPKERDEMDQNEQVDAMDDDEQCVICAEKIWYASVSPCNHRTCHKCTLRQRALFGKKQCLVCRTENEKVIFTDQLTKEYDEFGAGDIAKRIDKYEIEVTAVSIYDAVIGLNENRCKVDDCRELFGSFRQLSDHTKNSHNKFYCLICSSNKKAFVAELALYSHKQLLRHQSEGDTEGFEGHPGCKHCRGKRFYSEDELNIHIREKHERCFICDQDTPKTADYFRDYDELFQHFSSAHYVCTIPICLDKKFVVFRDDLELTSHMLKEHGGLVGSSGKVIVGSGLQYQSRLSTFNGNSSSALSLGNSTTNRQRNPDSTPEIKRKRIEERAKHYLNYDQGEVDKFLKLIGDYSSGRIPAKEVLNQTKTIFQERDETEINILMFELGELFPQTSTMHKDLNKVAKEFLRKFDQDLFPILGGSWSPVSGNIHSWGNNTIASNSVEERFPALAKPKKSQSPVNPNQPIRYSKIVRKTGNNYSSVKVNTGVADPDFKPTYLQSKSSSSASPSPLSSSTNLPESKFPALQKKTKKKTFPRVNPIDFETPWGAQTTSNASVDSSDEIDMDLNDKRRQKQKKKKERILFAT